MIYLTFLISALCFVLNFPHLQDIKEQEFQKNICHTLPFFYTYPPKDLPENFEEIYETYDTLKEQINFFEDINKTENALKVQKIDRNCQREKRSIDFWIDFFGVILILWISVWGIILIAMFFVRLRNIL